jgi:hypothetical protein
MFQISPKHPLRQLFTRLVSESLRPLPDPDMAQYLSSLLVDFTHADNLYRIRNARGKRLEDVGEMLIASNPLLEGRSFEYEREVRKHVGDYTLFLTGLFPEYVARLPRKPFRLDAFVDYMKAGKESYNVVASFNLGEYRNEAPLFRKLSDQFEYCVYSLNRVKDDLSRMQHGYYRGLRQALDV